MRTRCVILSPWRRAALVASAIAFALGTILVAPPAVAQRRVEKAAQDALKKAEDDYLTTSFDKGLRRCGPARRLAPLLQA